MISCHCRSNRLSESDAASDDGRFKKKKSRTYLGGDALHIL
jgi:hypothetical protein